MGIVNIVGLLAAWYYTDLNGTSVMQNAICPVLVALFVMSLLIEFVLFLGVVEAGGYGGGANGCAGGDGVVVAMAADVDCGFENY